MTTKQAGWGFANNLQMSARDLIYQTYSKQDLLWVCIIVPNKRSLKYLFTVIVSERCYPYEHLSERWVDPFRIIHRIRREPQTLEIKAWNHQWAWWHNDEKLWLGLFLWYDSLPYRSWTDMNTSFPSRSPHNSPHGQALHTSNSPLMLVEEGQKHRQKPWGH